MGQRRPHSPKSDLKGGGAQNCFPLEGSPLFSLEDASGAPEGPGTWDGRGARWSVGCEGEKSGGAAGGAPRAAPSLRPPWPWVSPTEGAGETESRFPTRPTDGSKQNPRHCGAARGLTATQRALKRRGAVLSLRGAAAGTQRRGAGGPGDGRLSGGAGPRAVAGSGWWVRRAVPAPPGGSGRGGCWLSVGLG